jgi:glycosyltransferase involved in cell wall biosynthesis
MRIAIVNWSRRKAGGAETYLDTVVKAFRCAGHETVFFCELDQPADREPIGFAQEFPIICVSAIGHERALDALRKWKPNVIYAHGMRDPVLEGRMLAVAPAVFFAHGYYGTCISGAKTFKYPVVTSCSRRFGWKCLVHFYPHRCGGLSPITMWKDFQLQSQRLKMLHSYRAIVTASEHMRSEYVRHGFAPEVVKVIPPPVCASSLDAIGTSCAFSSEADHGCERQEGAQLAKNRRVGVCTEVSYHRLLYVGRLELLKGGDVLLDALPVIRTVISRPLQLTCVGDGRERLKWEEKAAGIQSREPGLSIRFTGWLEGAQLQRVIRESDLLVVPSLWPEPFGLVGPEAGLWGVPAAAFGVGGIPEWLNDGVNGYIAPADRLTPMALAKAVVSCLQDPQVHESLCLGALRVASQFSLAKHMGQLMHLFESIAGSDGSHVMKDHSADAD